VRSRSILGLGLPSSAVIIANDHWNCSFVSNQGAFNVSRISGQSTLISIGGIAGRNEKINHKQIFN